MKNTIAERGRRYAALKRDAERVGAEKNAFESKALTLGRLLKTTEEELKRAAEGKAAAESAAEASSAESDRQARKVSDLESEIAIMTADLEAAAAIKEELAGAKAELGAAVTEREGLRLELAEEKLKSGKLRDEARSLSDRLAVVERRIEEAKEDAVEEYKNSRDFTEDVALSSASSYRLGFADCKEKISKFCPKLDLSGIQPPGDEESSDGEEEEEQGTVDFADLVADALQTDIPRGGGESEPAPIAALAEAGEEPAISAPVIGSAGEEPAISASAIAEEEPTVFASPEVAGGLYD